MNENPLVFPLLSDSIFAVLSLKHVIKRFLNERADEIRILNDSVLRKNLFARIFSKLKKLVQKI